MDKVCGKKAWGYELWKLVRRGAADATELFTFWFVHGTVPDK